MSITKTKANCKYIFLKNDIDKNAHKAYNARRIKSAHYESLMEMSALKMHKLNNGGKMRAQFITAADVAEIMGVSRSKAYQIVRDMNRELKGMGYITVSGKCPVQYFQKKFYGMQIGGESNERM